MAPRRSWVLAIAAMGAAGTGAATAGWHGGTVPVDTHTQAVTPSTTEATVSVSAGLDRQLASLQHQESQLATAIKAEEQAPLPTAPPTAAPPYPPTTNGAPAPAAEAIPTTASAPVTHATTGASSATTSGAAGSDDRSDSSGDRPEGGDG